MTGPGLFHFLKETYDASWKQLKDLIRILLIYNGILAVVFVSIWIIGSQNHADFGWLTRDPAQLFNFNPLTGFISHLGIFMWCATATLCFFVYVVSKDHQGKAVRRFLISSGFLTLYLLLDDVFLIHEILGPRYTIVKQNYFYAIYFFIVLAYLILNLKPVLSSEFILLILSFAYFGVSIVLDYISGKIDHEINTLIEDGFKFAGIMTWFLYFCRICLNIVRRQVRLSA